MSVLIKSSQPCPYCKSSDAYAIYDDNEHCFSCGHHKNTKKTFINVKPREFTSELLSHDPIPQDIINWFLSVGIDMELLEHNNIYFNQHFNAIIIEMYRNGKHVGNHIRYVNGDRKSCNVGSTAPVYITSPTACVGQICLVEDIRSALKVAQVCDTLCLLGTSLSTQDRLKLVDKYDIIYLWLDGDEAGKKSSKKIFDKLKMCTTVKYIETKKDPKYYSLDEIKDKLR